MTTVLSEQSRLSGLINNLKKAIDRLNESLALAPTRIHKDATIQRFEFTVELAWKTMQSAARFMGEDASSPREAVRVCARIDLITDPEAWLTMLTARNLTAHMYQESVADEVYEQSKILPKLVENLIEKITRRISDT